MKDDTPPAPPLTSEEKRRLHEIFAEVPFAHLLGITLDDVGRGTATLGLVIRDELRRNGGITHGGATASLIDSAAAFAIMTLLEPGQSTTTIDLTIHYLRPLLEGRARAQARVIRAGRRVAVVSVDVLNEAEVVAATAVTTYLRLS